VLIPQGMKQDEAEELQLLRALSHLDLFSLALPRTLFTKRKSGPSSLPTILKSTQDNALVRRLNSDVTCWLWFKLNACISLWSSSKPIMISHTRITELNVKISRASIFS